MVVYHVSVPATDNNYLYPEDIWVQVGKSAKEFHAHKTNRYL